jgi:hypothetical protein
VDCTRQRWGWQFPYAVNVRMMAALLIVLIVSATLAGVPPQTPLGVEELAQYRLTTAVLEKFEIASRAIAAASRTDPSLVQEPAFSQGVARSDDAAAAAATLEKRLQTHPALVGALRAARLSAREYTKFALGVIAAHAAYGFVKTGVLRRVPAGTAAANVAFVEDHEARITTLLADLGIN